MQVLAAIVRPRSVSGPCRADKLCGQALDGDKPDRKKPRKTFCRCISQHQVDANASCSLVGLCCTDRLPAVCVAAGGPWRSRVSPLRFCSARDLRVVTVRSLSEVRSSRQAAGAHRIVDLLSFANAEAPRFLDSSSGGLASRLASFAYLDQVRG